MKKFWSIFLPIFVGVAGIALISGLTAFIILHSGGVSHNEVSHIDDVDVAVVENEDILLYNFEFEPPTMPSTSDEEAEEVTSEAEAPSEEADATEEVVDPVESTAVTEVATEPPVAETTPPATESPKATEPAKPAETPKPTEPAHTHSYTSSVVKATCSDKGYTKYTCSCGKSYNDNYTSTLSHNYTSSVVAATCTAKGYTKYTCSSCGKSYTDNQTDATGHKYTESVVEPTTSAEGYTLHTCSQCGNSYKDNYAEKLKIVYDYKQAQQVANNYIASFGCYVVDSSLPYGVCGYYPASCHSGIGIELCGGQEWLNSKATEAVRGTINTLLATEPDGDISGYRLYCEIVYDSASDNYWITVYYG